MKSIFIIIFTTQLAVFVHGRWGSGSRTDYTHLTQDLNWGNCSWVDIPEDIRLIEKYWTFWRKGGHIEDNDGHELLNFESMCDHIHAADM